MTTSSSPAQTGFLEDSFSPILVKELRQGMRARVFVLSFLLLQVFLIMFVLADVAAQDDRVALQAQSYYFWVIVDFALLLLMPLRGLFAISGEIRNRTIETILLTRLTSWRVVFGKWSALFSQSLLLVSAVLPYVVLRYFIGGEDIISDFEWLLLVLWLSGLLIAASIAISALGNIVFRIAMIIGLVTLVMSGSGALFYPTGYGSGTTAGWEMGGWLVLYGIFIPAILFEMTASGLAPASENHALPRRFYALTFFLLSCLLSWGAHSTGPAIALPLFLLIGICYFDLCEKPRVIARMVQAFARKPLGRLLAIFFLPGWPSALLFSLFVIPISITLFYRLVPSIDLSTMPKVLPILAVLGSILAPILVCHLFWKRMTQVLIVAFFYNAILLAFASFLVAESSVTHTRVAPLLAFVPSVPALMVAETNYGLHTAEALDATSNDSNWYLCGNTLVVGVMLIVLLVRSRPYFQQVFAAARPIPSATTGGPALPEKSP